MKEIETYLDNFPFEKVNPSYIKFDERFSACPEDYGVRGIRANSHKFIPLEKIIFKPDYTNYGLVLHGKKKGKKIDIAVLGFNVNNDAADCLEIHGGHGMYKQLKTIQWERVLLNGLINLSKRVDISAVQLIPSHLVEGSSEDLERLRKRYDMTAQSFGFRYSRESSRFVLEL